MTTTHFLLLLSLAGCAVGSDEADPAGGASGGKADTAVSVTVPWGGGDPAKHQPEAIIANAVSAELARDPSARVSIPATIWTSQTAPFGDGQTNAAASFAHWKGSRPPVVGVKRGARVTVRFDRTLPIGEGVFELWTAGGAWVRSVPSTRSSEGDWVVDLGEAPDDLVVSPRGWRDGFPLSFAMPIASIDQLAKSFPKTLPGGEPVVDPVGAARGPAYEVLKSSSFPQGFVNQTPYIADDVHAAFPQIGAPRITAVGGAYTWVASSPFKNLYVCFDERSPAREAQYGVPSGAGWHHIGDAGESILASLEAEPMLAGHARAAQLAPPPGGQFAYGLDRATTYALLQPGQAFTTLRGEFHWYAVHHATKPCVQIWVH